MAVAGQIGGGQSLVRRSQARIREATYGPYLI